MTGIKQLFDERSPNLKRRIVAIYALLAALNGGAWVWALISFHHRPGMLGIALVIYGLGLRHAVDADHIAAIDNVTRKLMQDRQRPVSVGFFFALGHSTVVTLAAGAVALVATVLGSFEVLRGVGELIGTGVSVLFLFAIAAMNIVIFASVYANYRRVRRGEPFVEEDLDLLLNNRGLLARVFRPAFRLVTRSWHMFPLGVLFGLGFDTATEVAVFGVSAAQAAQGIPFVAIMVFPVLFAAGMSLIDTTDGVVMLGAYEWAFVKPIRKLYYNMTITLVSVIVAIVVGGDEALGLIGDRFDLRGGVWDGIRASNENITGVGLAIIGVFLAAWVVSYLVYRMKRLGDLDVRSV